MRRLLPLLLLLLPGHADAASRRLFVSSFDRIRVEGPFQVTVTVGTGASGTVSGDQTGIDRAEVRVDGATLVVRAASLDTTRDGAGPASEPVRVTLTTPGLRGAALLGGGALTVAGRGRTPRIDVSVAGAGTVGWTGADTELATVTVIGNGQVTIAGRAATARALINGAGKLDAAALEAGDLTLRLDGPGEATARARYTATVVNTGLGRIAVAGAPKCTVRNQAGGPVTCGIAATPAN